ncbi:MAG: SIS domain-containing protein [Candidatus Nanopelagicaceae bacterium]|nr:SIS domain-containing protein [Candidatus Nanopelagicaceae bacterium]
MNEKLPITATTYLEKLQTVLATLDRNQIDHAVDLVSTAWEKGRQIITLGNGGSSLTALHFINDWNKSIFLSSGKSFRGRCLVDNMGLVMSYSNDISFQDVFVEQLKNIMEPGDLVLALSGSGNSENVLRAVQYANEHGAVTLGLCGFSGGKLKDIAHYHVWAAVNDMQISEDVHAIFGHIVMQALCGTRSC